MILQQLADYLRDRRHSDPDEQRQQEEHEQGLMDGEVNDLPHGSEEPFEVHRTLRHHPIARPHSRRDGDSPAPLDLLGQGRVVLIELTEGLL